MTTAKEEGIEEGIKQGANIKAIEIAKKLIGLLDDETISDKTGLSIKEIKELKIH